MVQLDNWQKEALEYDGDLLMCTGRRVGKTYVLARKAVDFIVKKKKPVILVSLTEDQAMIILSMALNYARERYPGLIGKGKYRPKLKELTLMINRKPIMIKVRPVGSTGDAVRGFEGGALGVDEASRMPPLFWIAAKPIILTTGGQIWMCSTPHGKQGYFWERFNDSYNNKDPEARFKVIYKTTEQVVEERPISSSWTEEHKRGAIKVLDEDRKEMSSLEYGQEYLGLFLDELRQYFSDELIERACTQKRRPNILRNRDYFLGVDIARMGKDDSTFEVIDMINKQNLVHVENQITRKTLTTQTEKRILQLNSQYDEIKKIYLDAGAGTLGVSIFDHLLDKEETKRKVVAINNRGRVLDRDGKKKQRLMKEDLYDNLRALMEMGYVSLLDDDSVKLSLRSVQYEYLDGGKMRIFGNDTHIAEGLIRAVWCVKEKGLKVWIGSIRI
jgi:hypothetical protein